MTGKFNLDINKRDEKYEKFDESAIDVANLSAPRFTFRSKPAYFAAPVIHG
jgi:hypothetical protein